MGKGRKANIFLSPRCQRVLVAQLTEIPLCGNWQVWLESQEERNADHAKRKKQREISTCIRMEVSEKIRTEVSKYDGFDWKTFRAESVDRFGRELICSLIPCVDKQALAFKWSRAKSQYPYFTMFVDNMLYCAAFAATKPNARIDLNAQADLDLMTHLLHADVLVSNETGFLRSAFDDLWRPQGKVIFSSQEFADFMQILQR
jgi:hypothetical protein